MASIAPVILDDADDTAKAILLLNLLGRDVSPDKLIEHYKTGDGHFRTYLGERNSSFSANCNVLMALLYSPDVRMHTAEIVSTTTFLCDLWWSANVEDKWVRSKSRHSRAIVPILSRYRILAPSIPECSSRKH